MNGRFQMQRGKNWILPKEMNENRFFWDSHWLEIWSNHLCPSMGPNGGIERGYGLSTLQLKLCSVLKVTTVRYTYGIFSFSSQL
jgi:hypothetical protein